MSRLEVGFSRLSLWVGVACLAGLGTMGASAQPTLNLPVGPVTTTVTGSPSVGLLPAYDTVQFSGITPGLDVNNTQTYLAWCAQENATINFQNAGPAPNTYVITLPFTLYNSYPNSGLQPGDQSPNWPQVNYILNHKNGASVVDIQEAIWMLLDGSYHSDPFIGTFTGSAGATALLNAAAADQLANGPFIPKPGQVVAVVLDSSNPTSLTGDGTPQDLLIEVPFGASTTLTTKSVTPATPVEPNTLITVVVTETNTGNTTISNVSVAGGDACGSGSISGGFMPATVATLAPLATADFTCTFNAGNTSGDWTAAASGTDPNGHPASTANESTSGNFTVIHPATTLTTASVTPGTLVEPNTTVTVTVTETNTGDSTITNVSVAGSGACSGGFTPPSVASLASGASANFTCTFNSGTASGSWSAAASGTDAAGNAAPTTNESTSGSFTIIQASTTLTTASVTPGTTVEPNTTITVVVTETNTGNSTITNVSVAGGGSCASFTPASVASLAMGASANFTCTFNSGTTSGSWSAAASGTDAGGRPAPTANESTSGSFTVIHPATTLTTKSVTSSPVLVGATVTVVVTETNSGTVALSNVSVSGGGSCASFSPASIASLPAGASQDFTCTFIAALPSPMTWFADGHGTDTLGNAAPSANEHQSGSVTITSPPPPSNVCGVTWGYWKNHVSLWPVTSLVLGSQTYSQTELINILGLAVKGDESISLAHQLIAAKLNVANGTNPATDGGAIAAADSLLSTFSGKLPYGVAASSPIGQQMTIVEGKLDDFNSDGKLQPGCTMPGGNNPQPIALACATSTGTVNVFYSSALVASGGIGPYTFSISAGSLPAGLTLNSSTGAITGTPTTAGTFNFTGKVVDSTASAAGTITSNCGITIAPPPTTNLKLACPMSTGQVGVNYSSALVASGGVPPYTYSIFNGSLPAGLLLNTSTGAITGIPTTAGNFSFTGKVTDNSGGSSNTTTNQCGVNVAPPPTTNVCGVTWGYWKNHTNNWGATSLVLGSQTYTKAELITILHTAVQGDASIDLAHQLIAAKLNVLNGTILSTAGGNISAADALLAQFPGKLPYGVSPSSTIGGQMTAVSSNLDDFNSDGKLQPGCIMPQ